MPGKILALSTFLVMLLPEYLGFLVLLLVLYQFAESRKLYWVVVFFAACVLILRVHAPHEGFPDKLKPEVITGFIRPFFEDKLRATLLTLLVFWLTIKRQSKSWLIYSGAVIVILVIILYILPAAYKKVSPPYENRSNWVKMQLWAKENTPLDAMFITPPYLQGFRVFSERGTLAEWKDGTQQYFKTEYSYEWWERINDIGMTDRKFYNNLTSEQFSKLCKKYGASYIVLPAAKKLELPHVYENKEYRVYTLARQQESLDK